MLDPRMRYTKTEQLILALAMAAQKLRPYFQAHVIVVLTNFPLHLIMTRSNTLERIISWAVELGEFDTKY